jgi:ferredoxin-NADP reductase/Na+-translocating ferredoxin:NAD+ oxidoreductase RnfD subunit
MNFIDSLLNKITMYRFVVYSLAIMVGVGILFAFQHRLPFTPTALVISFALILGSAYVTDRGFSRLFRSPSNMESALITSLILLLIVQPAHSIETGLVLILGGAVSSASKYLIAVNGKHIFNPAAFAAATLSLTGLQAATWWIGSAIFWPYTAVLGLLIMRKIKRTPMVLAFGIVACALQCFIFLFHHELDGSLLRHMLFASPLIFLASVMLTEPATMPPRRSLRLVFAVLVAVLYVEAWKIGPFIIYPEVALLLGNIFAWLVSPKFRVRLELKEIHRVSDRVYDYVFKPDHRFSFLPGQYMEWTLAEVPYDSRGNRRTFTIASSPTEEEVHLGIKYYEPASMYKATLDKLEPGDVVYASQLAGNFTLKGNEKKKLVFIAGGIGITPFRSMIKYVTDMETPVDVTLIYAVNDPKEFAYVREIQAAAAVGVRVVPVVTDLNYQRSGVITSKVTAELVKQEVPDYPERTFYVSGPNAMVDATTAHLHALGVFGTRIITDHFSGY